jgi:uncharacterized protein YcfJ
MTRFSTGAWKTRTAAIALIAAFLAAPLAASPALADGWGHGRDESRPTAYHADRDQHFDRDDRRGDRDDWRRAVVVAPAPVYAAPAYAPPRIVYAPAPPPAPHYAAPVVASRAIVCSNGAVAGGLIGAATGGIIGAQFGRGPGNTAATIVGILSGAAVGASVGQSAAGCY